MSKALRVKNIVDKTKATKQFILSIKTNRRLERSRTPTPLAHMAKDKNRISKTKYYNEKSTFSEEN